MTHNAERTSNYQYHVINVSHIQINVKHYFNYVLNNAENWGVKYRNPNIKNSNSEGTSVARIIIFNLAYYEYARKYKLKRPLFIIHDGGITNVSQDAKERIYEYITNNEIQVIIAALKQDELNDIMEKYTCKEKDFETGEDVPLNLSKDNKLFRRP